MDKSISSSGSFKEAEKAKRFNSNDTLSERLQQSWYLTCMAYGIDHNTPPKMEKKLFSVRKHTQ
ncbi:hypothetical protein [Ferruginibacter albus]|uniref:hypothetical protein n=1 Tax=Ferruginibacter albus TaxID=2875540 RepID=UPI001CC4BE66|nr:hypothetical protein [Ferruginibacter albus]UAY51809.1 hypothetical protein K9M53_14600 [Ferruginibacter albus]